MTGSMSSSKRERSIHSGSLSSNASSLRKRFALSRENSKLDGDSKIGSVWRTLSKTARGAVAGEGHAVKLTLTRSKSTDVDGRLLPPTPPIPPPLGRPMSKDRPTVLGEWPGHWGGGGDSSPSSSRPSSSRLPQTPTTMISSRTMTMEQRSGLANLPRKKRRSSLSDLPSLQNSPATSTTTPTRTTTATAMGSPVQRRIMVDGVYHNSPRRPSPSKSIVGRSQVDPSLSNTVGQENSPLSPSSSSTTSTTTMTTTARGTLMERATNIQSEEACHQASSSSTAKRSNASLSGIPTLNGGSIRGKVGISGVSGTDSLGGRPGSSSVTSSPPKIRLPSPQKVCLSLSVEIILCSCPPYQTKPHLIPREGWYMKADKYGT